MFVPMDLECFLKQNFTSDLKIESLKITELIIIIGSTMNYTGRFIDVRTILKRHHGYVCAHLHSEYTFSGHKFSYKITGKDQI